MSSSQRDRAARGPLALLLVPLALAGCATGRPAPSPGPSPRPFAGPVELYRTEVKDAAGTRTFVKRYDPKTGGIDAGILAPDGSLGREPLPSRERVSAGLAAQLAAAKPDDRLPVVLWLAVPARRAPQLPATPAQFDRAAFARSEDEADALYQADKDGAVARLGLAAGELRTAVAYTPAVIAELTAARLAEVLRDPRVVAAEKKLPMRPTPLGGPRVPSGYAKDALDEMGMTYLHDTLHLIGGSTGKLAVWEQGRCIDSVDLYDRIDPAPKSGLCDRHANAVMDVAASFDLFSYLVDSTYSSISEEQALSDTLLRVRPFAVVNKSEVTYYDKPADYDENAWVNSADHILDAAANGRLSAQLVLAAGNNMGGEYVLHHSFNTLKVAQTAPSSWKNPHSPHGDRELPEIAARTTFPTGTSLSAPAVAGTLTVLQDAHGAMTVPMLARSVLLAGAWHQLDPGPSWIEDVKAHQDRRYGAGEMDARESYEILAAAGVNPGGARGAWWGGIGIAGDGSITHRDFPFRLPGTGTSRLRAALAWNNVAIGDPGWDLDYDLFDLDVLLLDAGGAVVASAASFDNNYEILETQVRRGETYTLRVASHPGAIADSTYFGLAWTSRE